MLEKRILLTSEWTYSEVPQGNLLMAFLKKEKKFLWLFLLLLSFDILSKYWVFSSIPRMSYLYPLYPFGGIGIFQNFFGISFSINLVENSGAVWGIFSGHERALFFLRLIAAIALAFFLLFQKDTRKAIPLLLILTGALGNLIDFLLYRYVIDMFHFVFWEYSYPVFNIADALITVGVVWLGILCIFYPKTSFHKS